MCVLDGVCIFFAQVNAELRANEFDEDKTTKLRDILSEFIIDEKSREIHPINEPRLLKVCY